jgi:hypothetical protein
VDSWTTRIRSWEHDRTQPNPYFNPSSGTSNNPFAAVTLTPIPPGPSEMEIRRRLTLEEERDNVASATVDPDDNFTETKYLLFGLDLEERQ